MRRIPAAQIVDDARKKAGLCHTQQKAQQRKADGAAGEGQCRSEYTPADHDTGNPATRSDSRKQQVARDLEQTVAQEKHAGPESELSRAEPQIRIHLESGESDVC